MSDSPLPFPALEPTPRRRKIGRRWIVAVAVVVFLALGLGGAAYGVKAKGDAKAEEYAKALNAWGDKRDDLLGAPGRPTASCGTSATPRPKKSLAEQKKSLARGC